MKIVRVNELTGVTFTGGVSFRPVLEKDNMGFGVCKTVIPKGGPYHWHYPEHLEACYCIKGVGKLTNLETGIEAMITTDVIYLLDQHDDHTFEAITDVVLISIFNPGLTGKEYHDENGQYKRPLTATSSSY
jgi:L-ectoine synthase